MVEFDLEFVDLSAKVYRLNDERCKVKEKIDIIYNSVIREEKHYD